MIISKKSLNHIIKEAFKTSEPTKPGEMQSSDHVMMTILVRKIYDSILDKESFFKNLSLIEKALLRAKENSASDLSLKFNNLESFLGNLQKIHQYEKDLEFHGEVDFGEIEEIL